MRDTCCFQHSTSNDFLKSWTEYRTFLYARYQKGVSLLGKGMRLVIEQRLWSEIETSQLEAQPKREFTITCASGNGEKLMLFNGMKFSMLIGKWARIAGNSNSLF